MLRQTLEALREELQRKLKDITQDPAKTRDLMTERSRDPVNGVQWEVSAAPAVCTINMDWETRRAIEAALDRIQTGDYGICECCGERISPKRLHAIPWANLCLRCQSCQEAERTLSMSIATLPDSQHGQHGGRNVWSGPLWTTLGF